MKTLILNEYNKNKKEPAEIGKNLKIALIEKRKTIGKVEAGGSFRKELTK